MYFSSAVLSAITVCLSAAVTRNPSDKDGRLIDRLDATLSKFLLKAFFDLSGMPATVVLLLGSLAAFSFAGLLMAPGCCEELLVAGTSDTVFLLTNKLSMVPIIISITAAPEYR